MATEETLFQTGGALSQSTAPEVDDELVDTPITGLPLKDRDLPPVIREVVTNAPASRKLPAFIACLSPLCALATRVRLDYCYDSRPSALLLQVLIEGAQSVGKSFAADIESLIMTSTLKLKDRQQRLLEQEYREKRRRRKANEKLDEEPKTTIRVIPPTISKTVLTKRADFYERILGDTLTFWMFAEELAQVTDAGRQGYSNLRTIMRTAYDLGSYFGMDFASDNSYSAIVDINICSMFCTTPSALDEYMDKKAIEGGNITRCIPCSLDDAMGSDGAIFQPYTEEQMGIIRSTLDKMMADTYNPDGTLAPTVTLDTSWLDKTVIHWCRAKGRLAAFNGSTAIDVFRKRSSVSAFRVAALCYYLYSLEGETGEEVRRRCRRIYLYMAEFILDGLISRWGKRFEEFNAKRNESFEDSRPQLFEQIPSEFTRDQLRQLITDLGLATPGRTFIYLWKRLKAIEEIEPNRYRKLLTTVRYH